MTRLTSFLEEQPPIIWALLAYVAAILLIAPWGDFPLNDDWQYAHLAKKLVETGRYRVDVPIAPSTVGQSLLAAPFIKVFGFSHTLLRLLTIALAAVTLWMLWRYLLWTKGFQAAKMRAAGRVGGPGRALSFFSLCSVPPRATSRVRTVLTLGRPAAVPHPAGAGRGRARPAAA